MGNVPLLFFSTLRNTIRGVIFMYQDLHELLMSSDSTRRYFMKLPVSVQLTVHRQNNEIHTAEALHRYVDHMTKING